MAKQEKRSPHEMYVAVTKPTAVRRNVLLATKQAIMFLKEYENLKESNAEKDAAFLALLKTMKELNVLVGKLKAFFPKSKLPHVGARKPAVKAQKQEAPKEEEVVKSANNDLRRLEQDLSAIESKLSGL